MTPVLDKHLPRWIHETCIALAQTNGAIAKWTVTGGVDNGSAFVAVKAALVNLANVLAENGFAPVEDQ
jgi:hypothetical protein